MSKLSEYIELKKYFKQILSQEDFVSKKALSAYKLKEILESNLESIKKLINPDYINSLNKAINQNLENELFKLINSKNQYANPIKLDKIFLMYYRQKIEKGYCLVNMRIGDNKVTITLKYNNKKQNEVVEINKKYNSEKITFAYTENARFVEELINANYDIFMNLFKEAEKYKKCFSNNLVCDFINYKILNRYRYFWFHAKNMPIVVLVNYATENIIFKMFFNELKFDEYIYEINVFFNNRSDEILKKLSVDIDELPEFIQEIVSSYFTNSAIKLEKKKQDK